MSNHRPRYVVAVCLLTFLLSVPFGYFFYQVGLTVFWSIQAGAPLLPSIPGFAQQQISYSDFSYAGLWRDRFVSVRPDHEKIMADPATGGFRTVVDWKVFLIDPETEISTETGWELSGSGYFTKVIGDRLLFCNSKLQFEVVDNVVQPADFPFQNDGESCWIKRSLNSIGIQNQGNSSSPDENLKDGSMTVLLSYQWTIRFITQLTHPKDRYWNAFVATIRSMRF